LRPSAALSIPQAELGSPHPVTPVRLVQKVHTLHAVHIVQPLQREHALHPVQAVHLVQIVHFPHTSRRGCTFGFAFFFASFGSVAFRGVGSIIRSVTRNVIAPPSCERHLQSPLRALASSQLEPQATIMRRPGKVGKPQSREP
jgi:hypothetical protein